MKPCSPSGYKAVQNVLSGQFPDRIRWVPVILSLVFILFSCKKNKDLVPEASYFLRVSQTSFQAGNTGSEMILKVEANSPWTFTLPTGTDWLQADKTSGNGNADIKFSVTKDNTSGAKRSVTITVSLVNGKADPKQVVMEQEVLPAQQLAILWKIMSGGSGNDMGLSVIKTSDGGHLVTGRTTSNNNGEVGPTNGGVDVWLVKLSEGGNLQWQRTLGGSSDEVAAAAAQTSDGGFVITGYTASNNTGDVGPNHGGLDYWVVKLGANGSVQWQKTLGGNSDEWPHAVTVTTEGKIVVAGFTKSNNSGDVGANHGQEDFWVVALDASGNLVWKKILGGNGSEIAKALAPTHDGGVIVGGTASSNNNGDVPATKGSSDFWIVRLDKDGNTGWKTTLGGNHIEELNALALGPDNTVVAAGSTRSNNGDVSNAKGGEDFWIVQLNASTGMANWKKTWGGTGAEVAKSVVVNGNGSMVVAGYSYSHNSGDVGNSAGAGDYWIVALNATGNLIWKKLMGGDDEELATGIARAENGAYVITGYTRSHNSGDVGANRGNSDVWTVKLKE